MNYTIKIDNNKIIPFNNNVDFCVGTGRMGLALHKEYFEQLKIVQDAIGFKFIRGHGLFSDDMAIYQDYIDKTGLKSPKEFANYREYMEYAEQNGKHTTEYNFTYLDRVIDSYLELNIRPFLELGFMPYKIASGKQTIFYWKGNTTPPADYDKWTTMVVKTLEHLISRYGEEEVLTWPIEVWNEPNLPGFWLNADIDEYCKLYKLTSQAIKKFNPKFKVGGPAICGGADEKWMKGFLSYCQKNNLTLDFISRHHYTTELPENKGHYGYAELMDLDYTLQTLKDCRKIIDSYPEYKDLPFNITEFNTSYIPNCPLHDTNLNAAYIARTLAEIGDYVTSYSYWTFGDVFEEQGVPFTPFHGGFGMLANGLIAKPTFWTFKFFKDLKTTLCDCVYRDKNIVIVHCKDGSYKGVAWNLSVETKESSIDFNIDLPESFNRGCLITKTVDEVSCNPLKLWHDLGEKPNPSLEEIELLKDAAKPLVQTNIIDTNKISIKADKNAVIYFELKDSPLIGDNGYDYGFYNDK